MKLIRLAPTLAVILCCIACDRREFEVSDKSRLENISLEVSDTSGQWLIGTTRTFTIKCMPDYARVQEFKLECSDESIFKIIQGVSVNSFDVTAIKEGESVIYASADSKKTEKSFSVYDDSIKKEDFEVKLFIQPFSGPGNNNELHKESTLDVGDRFYMTASSICETPAYDLTSSDETVISVEWYNNGSWVIYARKPGKCDLVLTVEDGLGNSFSYRYAILVYGHIKLACTYDILEYTGGFSVENHQYEIGNAEILVSGTVYGSPWNDDDNIVEKDIVPMSGIYDMASGAVYPDIIDTSKESTEITGMYELEGSEKIWYTINGIQMEFIIKLDDPYIIIDGIIDDDSRDYPMYYNFMTKASLQQGGVVSF